MTIDRESLRPAFERWYLKKTDTPVGPRTGEGYTWLEDDLAWCAFCAAFESLGEPVAWLRGDELRKLGRPYSDAPLNAKTDSMLIHAKGTPESAAKFGHGVPVYRLPEVKA